MCKNDENEKLIKMPVAKRSLFLTLIGVPMMFIAAFGRENVVCLILSAAYVILLFINGITCFPFIVKNICKKDKTK